eukprot:TRINITY_DN73429_c0_g1_i1.p1 TRINITY_DN73429_c0_g1~~TRINITY_DN73429_c0_g1_i1.p1  ORF type:complete len:403 (+),score=41.13 TRINITY_DN73429_c0_g1_i1:78-1211(+)
MERWRKYTDNLQYADLGDIKMRYADTAPGDKTGRPLVIFMHGWPESWFSWRHQLEAMHAAGFRGIAPDMRGYGGTSIPEDVEAYGVHKRCGDMLKLLGHLGATRAAFVGHDHGAFTGWHLTLLYPDAVACYFAMSVAYTGRSLVPMHWALRYVYGDEAKPEGSAYGLGLLALGLWKRPPKYFYQLHHNLRDSHKDYEEDSRAALMAFYGDPTDGAVPAEYSIQGPLYANGGTPAMWKRIPRPTKLLPWVSQEEFDYLLGEYERSGWSGGMNWYRTMDADWYATRDLAGQGGMLRRPVGFLAGKNDIVLKFFGGEARIRRKLPAYCAANKPPVTIVEEPSGQRKPHVCGHWIQQEKPEECNAALLAFLREYYTVGSKL